MCKVQVNTVYTACIEYLHINIQRKCRASLKSKKKRQMSSDVVMSSYLERCVVSMCVAFHKKPPKLESSFKNSTLLSIFIYANSTALLFFFPELVHWWNKEQRADERINFEWKSDKWNRLILTNE